MTKAKKRAEFIRFAKSLPGPGTSMLASARPPFDLDKAIRALKRRAAYWRRVASLATKQVDGYRFQDAPLFNATAMGLDEAIAILSRHLKPVPERGVRRKRRVGKKKI